MAVDGNISITINDQGHVSATVSMTDGDYDLITHTNRKHFKLRWWQIGNSSNQGQLNHDLGGPRYLGTVGTSQFPEGAYMFYGAKAYTKPKHTFIKITRYRSIRQSRTVQNITPDPVVIDPVDNSPPQVTAKEWLVPVLHNLF